MYFIISSSSFQVFMSRQLNDQLSVDFLAQLVDLARALQRYCIGQGFESPTSQIFFAGFIFGTSKVESETTIIHFTFNCLAVMSLYVKAQT